MWKNPENLNEGKNELERLEETLRINKPLATVYYMKDLLRSFWNCWSYTDAVSFIEQWIEEAKATGIRMLYGMAKTLERHRQGY